MSNQLSKMIHCAKGCTPPPDVGWIKGVTSALCYTVCLWRALHVHQCIDTQLHVSDPINLGIKVPVGDFDLWPNGGSQSSNCNRHNYFGDVVCSHVEAKLLFSATMRANCHMARKCGSYRQFKSGRCGNKILSPIGWNLGANESNHDFPNNYYMDTEFTSGDFCGITDVRDVPLSTSSIETTESTALSPINRGLKPVKTIKREKENEPKYSKWCLGMSWFGLCKSKTATESNVSVRIQFGDMSDTTTTSTTSSTTLPPTTLYSTVDYETVWTQRDTATSIDKPSSTTKRNQGGHKMNSKWCLGMSWFGLCASKTVFQPIETSTITSTTTTTTTSTATTTTTQTYSDDYYNYY